MIAFLYISEITKSIPECALNIYLFYVLGWKVVLVDFFELNSFRLLHQAVLVSGELWSLSWELTCIQSISSSKTCQIINKPSLVTADRAVGQYFLPIIFMAFLQPEEGGRWTLLALQSEMLFFRKLNFSHKRIFWCQPQGLWGRHTFED